MKKNILFLMAASALLYGCAAPATTPAPMPELTRPVELEQEAVYNPGSMFDPNRAEYLYDDNRAWRVGDIVMVVVTENTTAKHTAETTAERETTTDMGMTAFPNTGPLGILGMPFGNSSDQLTVKAKATNDFEGTGETKRESEFSATVATRIVNRLPGNVLQVEGARRIQVNNETQILVVRGLLRQRDIQSDNSVPSANLAEAQIELYGNGVLADKQKPGWLSRILDNIYPF